MRHFTRDTANKILANEIKVDTLLSQYPEYKNQVLKELKSIKRSENSSVIRSVINKYTSNAKIAVEKIKNSEFNEKTINAFLPHIIKARFAMRLLEHVNIAVLSNQQASNIRFNLWDGMILQKLLFKKELQRKPVSLRLFRFSWKFVIKKRILIPLVNKSGIYCFYSKSFLRELSSLIGERACLEIGAGDGTLTKFLNEMNIICKATDDYSWSHFINYPEHVEKLDAKQALIKYKPKVVICSWPVPNNTYEKHVFKTNSVELYIVIGSKNPLVTSDFEAYYNEKQFTMEFSERLSSMILPPSKDNAVFLFNRHIRT